MDYKDKCQLVLYLIDKVDYYWKFFYISTATVLGCIICKNLLVDTLFTKLLLEFIYVIFLSGNLFDHLRAYRFLRKLLKEIQEIQDDQKEFDNNEIFQSIAQLPYKYEYYSCIFAYVFVFSINSYLFII